MGVEGHCKTARAKQVDIAEITYHLAYLAQKEGFCRILWSRDEILPDFASGDAYRSR